MSGAPRAEDELALLLAGTAARREHLSERIGELAERGDPRAIARTFRAHRLLALLGGRLAQHAPEAVAPALSDEIEGALGEGRRRALLYEHVTVRLLDRLERAGIRALPLKGPLLAARIHGDSGLRDSTDIDLLVDRDDLDAAVAVLSSEGYEEEVAAPRKGRLPPLHRALAASAGGLPPVDLHWRVHWYENAFSREMLTRAAEPPPLRAELADELATLLLFDARDGFSGLRYASDIGAWWDTYGGSLTAPALDALLTEHPPLRRALVTSVAVATRVAGVPAERLLTDWRPLERRCRLAAQLANWSLSGDFDQIISNRVLIDLLLSPPGGEFAFARRFLVPSRSGVVHYEHLPPDARPPRLVWSALHAPKLAVRSAVALRRVRGGREWAPVALRRG